MDKESISRLGLDYIKNIDYDNSIEVYNPTNHNHIIYLKLLKDDTFGYEDSNYGLLKIINWSILYFYLKGLYIGLKLDIEPTRSYRASCYYKAKNELYTWNNQD